jgi:hypothetical protein
VSQAFGAVTRAGGSTTRLKLRRSALRKLRRVRAVRFTLLLTAADAAGNKATRRMKITLRT